MTLKTAKAKTRKRGKGGARMPPDDPALLTVSHEALLDGGSDKRFRQLVSIC